ncbi:Carnosine N-methyltransferase [Cyberlindnera fabianii]|uniref:Carnosine N-methyltransferase n=1 Tax=Cyberlindnera fabianii TaxID=36022 RepID=A0A1V2L1R6_CYBFA|nr:Carnosine N-methyltransferase [Cyberlindnera fabianii]
MVSTVHRSKFPWLVQKLFKSDMDSHRQGIVDAVATLSAYEGNTLAWNDKKRKNLKFLGWDGYQQAKKAGFVKHMDDVDKAIRVNGQLSKAIASHAIKKYDLSPMETRAGTNKGNGKAIEVLTHYARDWTVISEELKPLLTFIKKSIDKHIDDKKKTLVIVPGSGLGRIAHELALLNFPKVETVEFSALMHLCNEFVYTSKDQFTIHPFLHTYSHHVTNKNHTRGVSFKGQDQPSNLKLNYGDFREFTVEDSAKYDTVLIVTAFFMDTAQNMFDYFQALETLVGEGQRGVWINVGPLKYGTAPFVELSLEEIGAVRKIRGWRDLDEPEAGEMAGYLTDSKGLWQGYYGLGKWVSELKK